MMNNKSNIGPSTSVKRHIEYNYYVNITFSTVTREPL